MTREEIATELMEARGRVGELTKRIQLLDKDDCVAKLKLYLGKYYKQIQEFSKTRVTCVYVYGIEEKHQRALDALEVSYYTDPGHDTYFEIGHYTMFHPYEEDSCYQWEEITKEEFEGHHEAVLLKITNSLKK